MQYVEWVEPFNKFNDPVIMRVSVETAIKTMRLLHDYQSDQQALDDFVVVNWGNIVEYA